MKTIIVGEKIKVLFLVFVGILSVALFWTWVNRFILSPQAAQKNVSVTMSPKTGNIEAGKTQEVTIIIASEGLENKISGVDLSLSITGGTITSLSPCSVVGGDSGAFSDLLSETGPAGRKSCVTLKPDVQLSNAVQFTATVSCAAATPLELSVNQDRSQVVGNTAEVLYGFGAVDKANFTCGGAGGGGITGPHANILFEPAHCDAAVGGKCDYEMKLSASEENDRISAYHLKLTFDPKIVKADSAALSASSVLSALAQAGTVITPGPAVGVPTTIPSKGGKACTTDQQCIDLMIGSGGCKAGASCPVRCQIDPGATSGTCVGDISKITPSSSPTTTVNPTSSATPKPIVTGIPLEPICRQELNKIDNEAGTIEIAYTCAKKVSDLPKSMSVKLSFTGVADGSDLIHVASSEIVGTISGGKFAVAAEDGSYTIGASTSGGKVSVETILRLQGVVHKPKAVTAIPVRIGLGDGGLKQPVYKTVEFKVGDDGLWRGTADFDATPGRSYKLLVKGNKHMQKKICEAVPKESFPGSYACDKGQIELKEGKNSLDFSNIVLLVGDLEPQDGLSNAHDQSLVRNLLGKSDAESVRLADVNFDGIVNAVDHSLMIAALSVRYDEQ